MRVVEGPEHQRLLLVREAEHQLVVRGERKVREGDLVGHTTPSDRQVGRLTALAHSDVPNTSLGLKSAAPFSLTAASLPSRSVAPMIAGCVVKRLHSFRTRATRFAAGIPSGRCSGVIADFVFCAFHGHSRCSIQ